MQNDFIIWVSAGHAKVIRDVIEQRAARIVAQFDANPDAKPAVFGVPLYLGQEDFLRWVENWQMPVLGAIAIGGDRGLVRLQYLKLFEEHGVSCPALVHATACVSPSAQIGCGSHILANAVVAAEATIGSVCIVNNGAVVDHECRIADGVHIAPGAVLCGCIDIGMNSMVGAGAVVLPRIRIGSNCVIGAGAVVTRDVPDNSVVVGSPARAQRTKVIGNS